MLRCAGKYTAVTLAVMSENSFSPHRGSASPRVALVSVCGSSCACTAVALRWPIRQLDNPLGISPIKSLLKVYMPPAPKGKFLLRLEVYSVLPRVSSQLRARRAGVSETSLPHGERLRGAGGGGPPLRAVGAPALRPRVLPRQGARPGASLSPARRTALLRRQRPRRALRAPPQLTTPLLGGQRRPPRWAARGRPDAFGEGRELQWLLRRHPIVVV